jgi:2-oxoglutarate dehydrogenase complex dehydrogenase (E1) component-like enzyme
MAMSMPQLGLKGVTRKASAATAEGSSTLHKKRLAQLFENLFSYAQVPVK